MNEIKKFRCWDKLNDRWVYFDLRDCLEHAPLKGLEPNEKTLQQYAGLNDKNGNPIYEGDIVHVNDGFIGNPREIVFYECAFKYKILEDIKSADNRPILHELRFINEYKKIKDIEVLGNIFENPEKLKS